MGIPFKMQAVVDSNNFQPLNLEHFILKIKE